MAVEITCTFEGVEEFKAALGRFDFGLHGHVHRQLESWATEVKESAKQLAPMKTGRLRSSIYAKVHEWVAQFGAEASYALFVEFGTHYMQARPYLYPAIQEHLSKLEQVVCEAIDAAKKEAGLT